MKKSPLIVSFNSGETAPDIDVRVDIDRYGSGCRTLQNSLPTVQGATRRVPGTYYVTVVKGD